MHVHLEDKVKTNVNKKTFILFIFLNWSKFIRVVAKIIVGQPNTKHFFLLGIVQYKTELDHPID